MIFTILAFIIVIYSIFNFKRGFFYYLVLQLIWFPNAKIIQNESIPSIPIWTVTSVAFFLMYLIKKRRIRKCNIDFPLIVPFFILAFSYFLTCFSSLEGFLSELFRVIGFIFSNLLEVYLMWKLINTKEDFYFILKRALFIFILAGIYGIIEFLIQTNPLLLYKSSLTPQGLSIYRVDMFRGYRVTSFFEHPIGTAVNFSMFLILMLNLKIRYLKTKEEKRYFGKFSFVLFAALSIICIFLTKMRSGLFFLLIGMFSFINFKKKSNYRFLAIIVIILIVALPFYYNYLNIFFSIFNQEAANQVGGSNLDMRFKQLYAVLELVKNHRLTGLGIDTLNQLSSTWSNRVLSLESIWLEEIAQHGILGVVSVAILIIDSLYVSIKNRSKAAFFFVLAYWITYSLTSLPFVRTSLYYLIFFFFIKMDSRNIHYSENKETT